MKKRKPWYTTNENGNWHSHENTLDAFQILKIELPYDPAILFLGIYLKELRSGSRRDISTPMFTAALSSTAKLWKQPNVQGMNG